MVKMHEMTKNEKVMLRLTETAIEHCDRQIKAATDPDTKREWLVRQLTCEKLLEAFKNTLNIKD